MIIELWRFEEIAKDDNKKLIRKTCLAELSHGIQTYDGKVVGWELASR